MKAEVWYSVSVLCHNTRMIILSLTSPAANLENSGGKGASLGRLSRLELPVPPGFIVTTEAYRQYIAANHLDKEITASLEAIPADDGDAQERASARIRSAFSAGSLTEDLCRSIVEEYSHLDPERGGVAVRSSATTEDLPDLSFAGQQDTFLNILGDDSLCKAIVDCWSSLWTARAIGYRMRNAIPHVQAALAVVVQKMVSSETSGVMFTANPLTGLLSESVIDATFGLGEALVLGQVEPDHFVVDSASGAIRSLSLGAKKTTTRPKTGGGVENLPGLNGEEQTLSGGQVQELVAAGQKIQKEYGCPQDIEWAFAGNQLFILQSRPITSLFPLPMVSFDPLIVWFSFGAFQGIIEPITPLGQEAIQRVALGVGNKLAVQLAFEEQDIFASAGERIWINISDVIRNPLGNRILGGFLGIGEPGTAAVLSQVIAYPQLGAGKGRIKLRTISRLLKFLWPAVKEMPRSIIRPEQARKRFDARLEAYLETVRIPTGSDRFENLANFAAFMSMQGGLADALAIVFPAFAPIMAPSLAALNLINRLLSPGKEDEKTISVLVLDVTRALPYNVTTEMDLALWKAAQVIKGDPVAEKAILSGDGAALASRYLAGELPGTARDAIRGFLDHYGMRGVGEIDLGQLRWREDPAPVIESLRSYLQISPEAAPDLVFEGSARREHSYRAHGRRGAPDQGRMGQGEDPARRCSSRARLAGCAGKSKIPGCASYGPSAFLFAGGW